MSDLTAPERAKPRRHVLADEMYVAIKAMLMDHVIRPEARVSIDGLAREFEVSPTPVREALARLESDGLVSKEPLRGYRATPLLTREQLDDLYQFRRLIEPWAARRAAENIDDAGASALREELASAVVPSGDGFRAYQGFAAHDTRFHALLTRLSGSEQVRLAFERTHCHLHIFRLYFAHDIGSEALAEHQRIADAVIDGDPSGAEQAMLDHLDTSRIQRLHTVHPESR